MVLVGEAAHPFVVRPFFFFFFLLKIFNLHKPASVTVFIPQRWGLKTQRHWDHYFLEYNAGNK